MLEALGMGYAENNAWFLENEFIQYSVQSTINSVSVSFGKEQSLISF